MSTDNIRCRIMEEELRAFWPQWHVVKRLGGGAYGDVFEICRDNYGVQMHSALKVLQIDDVPTSYTLPLEEVRPHSAGDDSRGLGSGGKVPEVFMNEIRIMDELRGAPNVVSIEDFYYREGENTSTLYVRMELLTSFEAVMNDRQRRGIPFTIAEVLKIGKDICTALSYCEQKGIIHRDIKPANLFVDAFGNYKVGDFGVSKRMETVHQTHSMTGIGTISYMAPEIFAGKTYNNTVDIYALGMVLYQLLNNGRTAFLPTSGPVTVRDVDVANYKRLRGEEIPPLAGRTAGGEIIDEQLDGIIRKACSPDSHKRYRTAGEFCRALSDYGARGTGTVTVTGEEGVPESRQRVAYKKKKDKDDRTVTAEPNPSGKLKIALALSVAVLVIALAALFVQLLRGSQPTGIAEETNETVTENEAAAEGVREETEAAAEPVETETGNAGEAAEAEAGAAGEAADAEAGITEGALKTVEAGKLHAAVNAAFPPYEMLSEGGSVIGIDVEVAEAIAQKLGLELVIDDMSFEELMPAVRTDKADIAISGLTASPERAQSVDFTDPYCDTAQAVIVREESSIKTPSDLNSGMKIGVKSGTVAQTFCMTDYGQNYVISFESSASAIEFLKLGEIDAFVIDQDYAQTFAAAGSGLRILDSRIYSESYVIAVNKENPDLYEAVEKALMELVSDGTVQRIKDKYLND